MSKFTTQKAVIAAVYMCYRTTVHAQPAASGSVFSLLQVKEDSD